MQKQLPVRCFEKPVIMRLQPEESPYEWMAREPQIKNDRLSTESCNWTELGTLATAILAPKSVPSPQCASGVSGEALHALDALVRCKVICCYAHLTLQALHILLGNSGISGGYIEAWNAAIGNRSG